MLSDRIGSMLLHVWVTEWFLWGEKREMYPPFLMQPQFTDLAVVGFSVYTVLPEEVEELAYCVGL